MSSRWWIVIRKRGGTEVFRITGAGPGLSEDVGKRQRRYVISMTIRTISFLLAVVLWNVQTVFAVIALVAGALLPYIAVVVANAGRESGRPAPSALVTPVHRELGSSYDDHPDDENNKEGRVLRLPPPENPH